MMKKLLLWSALLMTGFAFYSCDDVIDNPAQGDSTVWKCTTNVTFADFDFKGLTDPESGEKYAYEAPKTLYVFNEQLEPLGTITTTTPPSAGATGKYSGNLCGVISDNLILTTKIGTDYSKQDGTIKSAIENGIVQTAKVGVKLYSNYSHELVTYDANMENEVAIAHLNIGWLNNGDELKISSENIANEDKALTFIIPEDVTAYDLYVAIPTNESKAYDYSIYVNTASSEVAEATFENLNLDKGKYNTLNPETNEAFHMWTKNVKSVDLTKWYAWENKNNPNPTGEQIYVISASDGTDVTLTQSGDKVLDSLEIQCWEGNTDKITINLQGVKLGKDRVFSLGASDFTVNLIGDNEWGKLDILRSAKVTTKGEGTLKCSTINMDDWWTGDHPELTICQNIDLEHLYIYNGYLTINEGVIVNITNTNEDNEALCLQRKAILTLAKGAELNVESKVKDKSVVKIEGWSWYSDRPTINIGENAKLSVQGAKDNVGLYISYATLNMEKGANVYLQGGLNNEYGIGHGAILEEATVTLAGEDATITAIGMDRTGLVVNGNTTINIAEKATFTAKDNLEGQALEVNGTLNITGKGTFQTNAKKKAAIVRGNLNLGGGAIVKLEQLAGATESAVVLEGGNINIAEDIKSVTVKCTMTTDPICITRNWPEEEVATAEIVGTPANFSDTIKDGVRTITPKAE